MRDRVSRYGVQPGPDPVTVEHLAEPVRVLYRYAPAGHLDAALMRALVYARAGELVLVSWAVEDPGVFPPPQWRLAANVVQR